MTIAQNDPPLPSQPADTTDVTLTFACRLQQIRESVWIHLIHNVSALRDIQLWDWGEDGGFYHWYKTQHEKWNYASHEYPASRDGSIRYYDENTLPLDRPKDPHFTRSNSSYPLEHTRHIFTCPRCSGSGEIPCDSCGKSGICRSCNGRGRTRSGKDETTCSSCSGSGKCNNCGGDGRVRCPRCKGEGKLLRYQSKDYKWWHDKDEGPILSKVVERGRVKRMIKTARNRGGGVLVKEFSANEVLQATGVLNDRIRELVQIANARRKELEAEIAARSQLVLFQHNERQYIPFSYINLSAGAKYSQFFAVGTNKHYEARGPKLPWDLWKCAFWFSLLALVMTFALPGIWPLIVASVMSAGLLGANLYRLSRELKHPPPARWIIFDDDYNRGWQFAFVLAQAVSRAQVGRVVDPWFTTLLEPPTADSVEGRNSFMYTMRRKNVEDSSTEILLLGIRAQYRYAQRAVEAIQTARRLVWLAGERSAAELDEVIAATLEQISDRARIEVIVICDEQAQGLTVEQFTSARANLEANHLQIWEIPMREMCKEWSGVVSEAAETGFTKLVEYSGFLPTLSIASESLLQPQLLAEEVKTQEQTGS